MQYAVLVDRNNSADFVNCATLVWKAHQHGAGIALGYNPVTVAPKNLVEGPGNMAIKVHANWDGAGW